MDRDLEAGDKVLCIADISSRHTAFGDWKPELGKHYTVEAMGKGICAVSGNVGVYLDLVEDEGAKEARGWNANHFRKIRPDRAEGSAHDWRMLLNANSRQFEYIEP